MPDIITVAIAAARCAGEIQRAQWRQPRIFREMTRHDIKLQTDVECEEAIREIITAAFPDHAILGEEGGGALDAGRPTWVVDPLDGTVNYARQVPHFCTSIAVQRDGRPVIGVVYDPLLDELFVAEEGVGAFLNDERITVSLAADLAAANVAVGFAKSVSTTTNMLAELSQLAHTAHKVRIMGAAALDLAYVAAGRFDGFVEYGLRTWDIAAGTLLVREAGGRVDLTPLDATTWDVRADNGLLW